MHLPDDANSATHFKRLLNARHREIIEIRCLLRLLADPVVETVVLTLFAEVTHVDQYSLSTQVVGAQEL